jgi:hypothetical protein
MFARKVRWQIPKQEETIRSLDWRKGKVRSMTRVAMGTKGDRRNASTYLCIEYSDVFLRAHSLVLESTTPGAGKVKSLENRGLVQNRNHHLVECLMWSRTAVQNRALLWLKRVTSLPVMGHR